MAGAGVLEFTDDNFETEVLKSDQAVLVDFWAPWCGPCRMLAPTIDQLATENSGKFRIGKLNTDEAPQTAARFGISAIPTVMIFKDGEVVNRIMGVKQKTELQNALNAAG